MNSDRIERVKGDIFDHSLQDSLGLDGLILQVRHGFNPVDVAWRKYMEHPNMRIDANTGVYAYNDGVHNVPTREEFASLIAHELDTLVGRGARRIGMNPLWFQDENGDRRGTMRQMNFLTTPSFHGSAPHPMQIRWIKSS